MRSVSRNTGFTLVELLIVIGVIALLISILLPSLAKARRQALIVAELSSMRQVGLAVTMYANDNKGRLPGGSGNAGPYPLSHDMVRARLCGYVLAAPWTYSKGGRSYLESSLELPDGMNSPSSKVWGCPMTSDLDDAYRYGGSWWWNAGPQGSCNGSGQSLTCTPAFTGNWWEQPSIADGYLLKITGAGYKDSAGRQPNPDDIVLITDAGNATGLPGQFPGHLKASAVNVGDVEGSCTLFLSGRALWRGRADLQAIWTGGPVWGYR